jgi:hypothetical protein
MLIESFCPLYLLTDHHVAPLSRAVETRWKDSGLSTRFHILDPFPISPHDLHTLSTPSFHGPFRAPSRPIQRSWERSASTRSRKAGSAIMSSSTLEIEWITVE